MCLKDIKYICKSCFKIDLAKKRQMTGLMTRLKVVY